MTRRSYQHTSVQDTSQPGGDDSSRGGRAARWVAAIALGLAVLVSVIAVVQRFRAEAAIPGSVFFDDAYYYFLPAQSFVETGRFSFDGIHSTNGFHPLWMALVVGAVWLNGGALDAGFAVTIFIISSLLNLLGAGFVYGLARRLRASPSGQLLAAVVYFTFGMSTLYWGVETPVWLATMAAFFWYLAGNEWPLTRGRATVAGLLASLLVLARIDMVLLVAAVLVSPAFVERGQAGETIRRYLLFAAGGVLLAAYLVANVTLTGLWFPVSGLVKGLKTTFWPSGYALGDLVMNVLDRKSLLLSLLLLAGAVGVLVWRGRRLVPDTHHRWLLWIGLLFPLGYVAFHLLRSDWLLWNWYYTPFFLAAALAVVTVDRWAVWRWGERAARVAVTSTAVLVAGLFGVRITQEAVADYGDNPYVAEARAITKFMETHPGRYGMGDRAGHAAFYGSEPVVQLEGLMMNKRYLELLREQRPLLEILREYGIDYYVAIRAEDPQVEVAVGNSTETRYVITEPYWRQAGRHSAVSRDTVGTVPYRLGDGIYVLDLNL